MIYRPHGATLRSRRKGRDRRGRRRAAALPPPPRWRAPPRTPRVPRAHPPCPGPPQVVYERQSAPVTQSAAYYIDQQPASGAVYSSAQYVDRTSYASYTQSPPSLQSQTTSRDLC